jgi:hypothetical protein
MNNILILNRDGDYTCIEPSAGTNLFDYYNGALRNEDAKRFEEHLFLCHTCQDNFLRLDAVLAALKVELREVDESCSAIG